MSDTDDSDPDVEALLERVEDLEAAVAALREFGDEHDIPAIERNAKRIEGSTEAIRQNVPGGLTRD